MIINVQNLPLTYQDLAVSRDCHVVTRRSLPAPHSNQSICSMCRTFTDMWLILGVNAFLFF